jgi:hypothetical protein
MVLNLLIPLESGVHVRSKTGLLIFSSFLCLFHGSVFALELTPESKLRKISFQMRGLPPSQADFNELAKSKTNDPALSSFFTKKIEEYYKSPWTASKLAEKIFEDWRLENAGEELGSAIPETVDSDLLLKYSPTGSDTTLMKGIQNSLLNGDSWDQVLISNDFLKTLKIANILQQLNSNFSYYGAKKIDNFKQEATAKGKKFDTDDEVLVLMAEYEKLTAEMTETERSTLFNSNTSAAPFFRNSHLDKKLAVLLFQGALTTTSPRHPELVNYLKQISDLESYISKINSSSYIKPTTGLGQNTSSTLAELPQLIFSHTSVTTRYQKTIYSKAAAFFRIYLCDDMQQVALPGTGSKSQDAFKIIHMPQAVSSAVSGTESAPPAPDTTAPLSVVAMKAKQHVQPQCLGCHIKLDPMELIYNKKFKRPSATDVSPVPFNFVYDDFTGKSITISVPNIDDLPAVISKQPNYIRCQSEKFWNWYVGSDVPYSPKHRSELEKVYVANQSKPLEIIKYLANLKLYTSDSFLSEPKQFNNVRPIFQKCHGCHKSDTTIPSLLETPFNLNRTSDAEKMADHFEIMKSIVKLTNILGDQKGIKMPTKDAGWKISESERKTLIKWIADGAKDENGVDTLTIEQKNKILAPTPAALMSSINQPAQLVPTLRSTWQRVLTYSEILKTVPVKIYGNLLNTENCFSDIIVKKYVLGHIDLYTALPISDQPDNAYREIYRKCVIKLLNQSKTSIKNAQQMSVTGDSVFKNADLSMRLKFTGFSKLAAALLLANPAENVFSAITKMKWNELNEERKLSIIQDQIQLILGPNQNHVSEEVDLDQSILKAVNRVAAKDSNGDVISASYFSLYYIFNSNSFLVY